MSKASFRRNKLTGNARGIDKRANIFDVAGWHGAPQSRYN
jgi:hypothetical protein